jgi:hypothetical protein
MKWLITFRQAQKNCCPPGKYWVVRKAEIEADTQEQAVEKLKHEWRYNHEIEIKRIDNGN